MVNEKKASQPLWLGGTAAAMAASCTHPLDLTKYRMQVQASSTPMLKQLCTYASREGILSLWSGISASILRQSVYSTTRFGLNNYLVQEVQNHYGTVSAASAIGCAAASGGVAGLLGNPTEVILVRMCTDGIKLPAEQYRYSNSITAFLRIFREEGGRAFLKGLTPTITRSVLMNVSQIAVYENTKTQLLARTSLTDGVPAHALSSLIAGTVATTVCAPADVLKSRFQSTAVTRNSESIVRYMLDCIKQEGPGFLMKGWTPAWLRLTPNTMLMFVFMEQLKRLVASSERSE